MPSKSSKNDLDEANKKLKKALSALKKKADDAQAAATAAKKQQELFENEYEAARNQNASNDNILKGKDKPDYSPEISKTNMYIEMSKKKFKK